MALTHKQEAFVTEYLKTWNATEAARRAKYRGNDVTLASIGSENLRKPLIAAAIRARVEEHAMTAHEVLWHLASIARGDYENVTDSAGNLDMQKARALEKTDLIKKVRARTVITDNSETHEAEVEMYDRLKALDLLAKYHDLINKVRIDNWQFQAITDIRTGNLDYKTLAEAFDTDLATYLFREAGVTVDTDDAT